MRLVFYEEKVHLERSNLLVCESHLFSLSINHGSDCLIKVAHEKCTTMVRPSYRCWPCGLTVHPYHHGSTASSTLAVWIRITTTARPPHQRRPCGSVLQPRLDRLINVGRADPYRNHGLAAPSKSTMWNLRDLSQPW
jgi:hypothetical protein